MNLPNQKIEKIAEVVVSVLYGRFRNFPEDAR